MPLPEKASHHLEQASRFADRAVANWSSDGVVRRCTEIARINLQIADLYMKAGL